MEELIASMTWWHWVGVYLILGLLLALGAAKTKVGSDPSWGWGPAVMIIIGWLPLIFILIINPKRYKGK